MPSQGVVEEGYSCGAVLRRIDVSILLSLDYVTRVYSMNLNASVIIMRHCVHYVKNKPV